jgi:hypothetical protein
MVVVFGEFGLTIRGETLVVLTAPIFLKDLGFDLFPDAETVIIWESKKRITAVFLNMMAMVMDEGNDQGQISPILSTWAKCATHGNKVNKNRIKIY